MFYMSYNAIIRLYHEFNCTLMWFYFMKVFVKRTIFGDSLITIHLFQTKELMETDDKSLYTK